MATEAWLGTSLATVVTWGLGTLVSKPATMRLGTRKMLAFVGVGEGSIYVLLFLAFRTDMSSADPYTLFASFLAGITGGLGYVFYYQGILEGTVGLMGTVTAAYPVPTILLALWLLGERVDLAQGAGIVLVLACVLFLSREPGAHRTGRSMTVVFALLAFLSWGLWGYFAKVAINGVGEGNLFGFYALTLVVVLGPFLVFTRKQKNEAPLAARGRGVLFGVLDVAFGSSGVILLTFAYALGPASLVSAVTGCYPLVSTLAAHFLLKEKFGRKDAVALALFVPGIALIAF